MMNLERVLNRIRSVPYPVRVWIADGEIGFGDDYPGGVNGQHWVAVGTYQSDGFSEEGFREDVQLSMRHDLDIAMAEVSK